MKTRPEIKDSESRLGPEIDWGHASVDRRFDYNRVRTIDHRLPYEDQDQLALQHCSSILEPSFSLCDVTHMLEESYIMRLDFDFTVTIQMMAYLDWIGEREIWIDRP